MLKRLVTLITAFALILGLFAFASVAPNTAEDVPVVAALVSEDASAGETYRCFSTGGCHITYIDHYSQLRCDWNTRQTYREHTTEENWFYWDSAKGYYVLDHKHVVHGPHWHYNGGYC